LYIGFIQHILNRNNIEGRMRNKVGYRVITLYVHTYTQQTLISKRELYESDYLNTDTLQRH